jgi:hypothetical protein
MWRAKSHKQRKDLYFLRMALFIKVLWSITVKGEGAGPSLVSAAVRSADTGRNTENALRGYFCLQLGGDRQSYSLGRLSLAETRGVPIPGKPDQAAPEIDPSGERNLRFENKQQEQIQKDKHHDHQL